MTARNAAARLALALLASVPSALHAQAAAERFELTIPSIMRGPEVYGREPRDVAWTPDGRWIYFRWNAPGTDWREPLRLYRMRADGGAPERVSDAALDTAGPLVQRGVLAPDQRRRAVAYEGDLYLVDQRTGAVRRLTETVAAEGSPQFGADGQRLYFVRENNVFALELEGGLVRQLTDIRSGPQPDSARAQGQRGALATDQRVLLEVIRDRLRADSIAEAERKARLERRVKPMYLQRDERVASISVSPGGGALLITTSLPAAKARTAQVPAYVTVSGYTEEIATRTKVGDEQSGGRLAWMRLPTGDVRWLDLFTADTTLALGSAAALGWNDAGTHAVVRAESRNYKARVIATVSADSGTVRSVDMLRDSAWVGGPCGSCAGWYPDGRRIWFVSEADGYAHLYRVAADGSDRRQLTRGQWEVLDVELSRDRRQFGLHTSEVSPFERHYYTMSVEGGARTQVTRGEGGHEVTPSPDGRLLADVYSTANRPPELYVQANRPGAAAVRRTTSPTAAWLSHAWIKPEIVRIPATDGIGVPARVYRPQDVGATANGAAVIFVHGAGYLHNVHNWWSSYSREYMFHHLLASKGYVVLDIDYRGSAGYGRDWRTAIYRHMGGRDLQDHVDGAKWLQQQHGIAPERIGIYGGSYGGFITLMALFTEPEWFGAGAALRSVTDWAHYNHPYTARILNTPERDSVAYRRSSPIFFAEGLQDPLLMAHGMVDVNVHYQDIVRLTQRLIELGKTDWELASYPVEDHAFVRPSSWTDEYRRIYELFERTIARPPGAAAAAGGQGGGAPK